MDAAPNLSPVPAPAPPPDVVRAWPPSAQRATAFLLGVTVTLLGVHCFSYLRGGTRPTDLVPASQIDLNAATHAELVQLPGVGETLARRISEHRPFRRVEELRQVPGIGPTVLERLRPWVCVTRSPPDAEPPAPRQSGVESRPVAMRTPAPAARTGGPRPVSKKEENLKDVIDVNRATADELQRLPGIGPKLSQRIVDERAKQPFRSVDDLRRVPGIGPKILERIRPYVTVGGDPQRVAQAG